MQPQSSNQEPAPDYGFLTNSPKPTRQPLVSPPSSTALRVVYVGGGIVVLLILFAILKTVFSGNNKLVPSMLSVAQQQQALVRLTTNGSQNAASDTLKNFSVTAQLSLGSEEKDIVAYLKTNGHKTSTKELNLKVSQSADTQLATALSAGSFDSTYKTMVQSQLKTYEQTLKLAYAQVKGPKGRALLQADFKAAELLNKQLES